MPELPEVETVMRGLCPVLHGRTITEVILHRPNLRYPFPDNLSDIVTGQTVKSLRRRGKYIMVNLDNDQSLICHLGMSGSFTINPSNLRPHDHVEFKTDRGDHLTYHDPRRFGFILLINSDTENDYPPFKAMGPEPLGNDFNAQILFQKLQARKTPVKTTLLDQSVVAGLGNIYVCEALYEAGISPLRLSCDISADEAEALTIAIRQVLTSAIESGGSTLRDHRQADGAMGYFQHNFKVYDRAGQQCAVTGGMIERIVQSGRSTFYCRDKQI